MAANPRLRVPGVGRGWSTARKAWTVFGVVVFLFGFLASVKPGLEALGDALSWLGANPVVPVLAGLISGAALLLGLREAAHPDPAAPVDAEAAEEEEVVIGPEHRAADKRTYEELVGLLTRNVIRFLREHDFGNAWSRELVMPLFEYEATRNDVEHRYLDAVLERRRQTLYAAVDSITTKLMRYGVWAKNLDGFYEIVGSDLVRDEPPEGERHERWEERRAEINEAADVVVGAYDALVLEARKRVP